ncbi:MAG: zinc metalloprotease HtpX [Deltaproteobacteria bacterium]|nr:zinc metalloprotease HtpX [Deltaproteobacteria bacterium]
MNYFKTTILLASLTALMLVVGRALGGETGMYYALIFAGLFNIGSYWFSDKIVLKMYRAKPITESESPALYSTVARLAQKARIPMPRLYLIPSPALNAFATGRSPQHAVVAVTDGLLRRLNRDELEGVLGHELSHVLNRDMLISTIAATAAGAISMLASMARWALIFGGGRSSNDRNGHHPFASIVMLIVAPIAAMLIQMAVSRSREYAADFSGAKLCGNPRTLASALRKLEKGAEQIPLTANPATAHLFIMNPLTGRGLMHLFSTHPPIGEGIRRLEAMRSATE